ncbi:hypothetical protein CAL29_14820 [Bordetella genomosp. 10]|uniref:Acylase n=1 Tax=Bordetella genomosp. 10 TaxID=1416804 RepID=A0A261SE76_9BORD|nr:penicillin acylase family protein [Bordetella genomosp. 10]OZI35100.1 hypothetical protein CAL29_14820 [Bordetella genomosp. 10]
MEVESFHFQEVGWEKQVGVRNGGAGSVVTRRYAAAATVFIAGMVGAGQTAAASATQPIDAQAVEIARTSDGIPHIKAADWRGLGYGYGYVQAEDNLCTLAEAFVTYRGERSRYFGADGKAAWHSTMGEPNNLDSDFFFRLLQTPARLQAYAAAQPADLRDLIDGYARGYDAYLAERSTDRTHAACANQAWVRPIDATDVYRRLYAANLAGGYMAFIKGIAAGVPVTGSSSDNARGARTDARAARGLARADGIDDAWFQAGRHAGIGSNGIALGSEATGVAHGLLLGNPHWFWTGPDRFYQAQLTIPGQIDVGGVSFLGVPVIMIGFNNAVAWTHTVSAARRFGLYELRRPAGDPGHYLVDGQRIALDEITLTVPVRQPDGSMGQVARTFQQTRLGPVVDLSTLSPALASTPERVFVIRDVNADNYRIFQNFLAWGRAGSLDEFVDLQKKYAAMPWVNTLAVGRKDGRAWYADIGAVPNVPDTLAAGCTTPLGQAVTRKMPGVPVLDGSRSACDWANDPHAAQAGALPAEKMPGLWRRDYVANMNNSHWLPNPQALLEGYPSVLGTERKALTLRQRQGFRLIDQAMRAPHGEGMRNVSPAALRDLALSSDAMSALLFRAQAVQGICQRSSVRVAGDPYTGKVYDPPIEVALGPACEVLRHWRGRARAGDRGPPLWDAFWNRLSRQDGATLYRRGFDPAHPLDTPADLNADSDVAAEALGAAVLALRDAGMPVDATRGDALFIDIAQTRIPLYGGCDGPGYFTSACAVWSKDAQGPGEASELQGNSYLQVVTFGSAGPRAWTMLASGESDDPANPAFGVGTLRYAQQQWTAWRFVPKEIKVDPGLRVRILHPGAMLSH